MSVESDLYDCLKSLVANRVYPDLQPMGTSLPCIVYEQIGGQIVEFYEDAVPSKRNAIFQVRCWAATRAAAATLARQVESALIVSTTLRASPESAHASDYDWDTDAYGTVQDFSIWHAA